MRASFLSGARRSYVNYLQGFIMGFWDSVNDEFKKAVEDGWDAVKESARVGKLKYRKHNLHRTADKHFGRIGGIVYELAKKPGEDPLQNPEVLRLVEEIKKIEAESAQLDNEIAAARKKGPEA